MKHFKFKNLTSTRTASKVFTYRYGNLLEIDVKAICSIYTLVVFIYALILVGPSLILNPRGNQVRGNEKCQRQEDA